MPGFIKKLPLQATNRKKWTIWLGILLLVFSCLVYALFLIMPFLPLSVGGKVAFSTGIVLVGEGMAWLGTLLVGTSLVTRYRRFLNPKNWFHRGEKTRATGTKELKSDERSAFSDGD